MAQSPERGRIREVCRSLCVVKVGEVHRESDCGFLLFQSSALFWFLLKEKIGLIRAIFLLYESGFKKLLLSLSL